MELGNFYPLCVLPPLQTDEGVKFLLPQGYGTLDEPIADKKLWAILLQCNGQQTVQEIVQKLSTDSEEVLASIAKLREEGVVVNSHEAWRHFHSFTTSPPAYCGEPLARERTHGYRWGFEPGPLPSTRLELLGLEQLARVSDVNLHVLPMYATPADQEGYTLSNADSLAVIDMHGEADRQELAFALDSDTCVYGAPLLVVISTQVAHNHDYRRAHLRVGRIVERLTVNAQMSGLTTHEHTDFNDHVLSTLLGLDESLIPLVVVGIGKLTPLQAGSHTEEEFQLLRATQVQPGGPIERLWVTTSSSDDADWQRYSVFTLRRGAGSLQSRASMGSASSTARAGIKAIAEGVERFALTQRYADLEAPASMLEYPWVDPRIVAQYTPAQLAAQGIQPFDPDEPYEWVKGVNLATKEPTYVLADMVFLRYGSTRVSGATSSGTAAGMSQEDATRRALLELLERGAAMRHWLTKQVPARVGYDELDKAQLDRAHHWHRQGRTVEILNLSHGGTAIAVVAIHAEEYPCLVTGAAASDTSFAAAVAKAFDEAELALRFALWSPSAPLEPTKVRTTLQHAQLYHHPEHLEHVSWLWQGELGPAPSDIRPVRERLDELRPVAVSFRGEFAPLNVVRVMSENLIPLAFGWGNDHRSHHTLPTWVREQTPFPHFFA